MKKQKQRKKNYPYISIEGIENQYLDASLMKCYENIVDKLIMEHPKMLKKADLTSQAVKNELYSNSELIKMCSPFVSENYDFYNAFANLWEDWQYKLLQEFEDIDYKSLSKADWAEMIRDWVDNEFFDLHEAVNFMRIYKNGELKDLLLPFLQEEENAWKFYRETDLKIEGIGLDWESMEEKFIDMEEDILFDFDDSEELFENPSDALAYASKLIFDASQKIKHLNSDKDYKSLYEELLQKQQEFDKEKKEINQKLKDKDTQIQTLTKQNASTSKKLDQQKTKIEEQNKEIGRYGKMLGDERKAKESLESLKDQLERRVNSLEAEKAESKETIKNQLEREYKLKYSMAKDDYERELGLLERELESAKQQLAQEEEKQAELSETITSLTNQLDELKTAKDQLEKEKAEYVEAEEVAVSKESTDQSENDEAEEIFDLDDAIENYVDFGSKPNRG